MLNYQVWIWTLGKIQTRVIIIASSAPNSLTNPHSYWMKAIGYSTRARVSQAKHRNRFIVGQMPDRLLHKLSSRQTFNWMILEVLSIRDAEAARLPWNVRVTKLSSPIYLNSLKYQTTNYRKLSRNKSRWTSSHHNHKHLLPLLPRNRMKLR
jgi:hypothetical protein